MDKKPNILLIVSDQLIASLTGAYGHPVVQTPHLDQLAAEGTRFDAAYSPCPVCAPARACLMSGTYTSVNGCYDNAALFPGDRPTFAHYLSNAGYDTVLSGKMHFVGADQLHGFSRRLTTDIYPSAFQWVKPEWIRVKETRGKGFEEIMADRQGYHASGYTGKGVRVGFWHPALSYDEETHFRALEYLHARGSDKKRRGETSPFLLCASYHHPHEPFWPPREYWDLYEGAEIDIPEFPENLDDTYSSMDRWLNAYHGTRRFDLRDPDSLRRLRRAYYAQVTYLDRKVGELLDSLEENGLGDDTVVFFVSDHGDMLCEKEMVQKRCFYEWSARIPFIARFPDGRGAGTSWSQPVSLVDLLPTFCDLAGVEQRQPCNGRSVLGLLDGTDTSEREAISEMHSEAIAVPSFMIRRGQYKYIYIHGHDGQLFDLEADPGEWNNLAGHPGYREIEARLRKRLLGSFDPDAIARDVLDSLHRRDIVKQTMEANRTSWDYFPPFDARKNSLEQYLPPDHS